MIASVLRLNRSDIKALRITDAYSLHRVVYSLYDDVRSAAEKQASVPSGILYVDKGGDGNTRNILLLANRSPRNPRYGQLESKIVPDIFLQHGNYAFEVTINPSKRDKGSGKTVVVSGRAEVAQWFVAKAPLSWGFTVKPQHLQIQNMSVKVFEKGAHTITQGSVSLKGELEVTNRNQFIRSFTQGIGRGRAFGFGLLQIVPIINPFNF